MLFSLLKTLWLWYDHINGFYTYDWYTILIHNFLQYNFMDLYNFPLCTIAPALRILLSPANTQLDYYPTQSSFDYTCVRDIICSIYFISTVCMSVLSIWYLLSVSIVYLTSIDWFHTKLYKRVLVNTTKRMKNNPFYCACSSINIWIFLIGPLQPS